MQDGIKDCGICCLLSIIRFYGGEVSKEYLRELTNTTKDGVTLYNLLEASKVIGFESQGMSGKIENIKGVINYGNYIYKSKTNTQYSE